MFQTSPQHPERRVIKRYANRKLYDTTTSCYVTLIEVAGYVRDGEDVRIIDNQTKEDLTSVTLAQILYEEEKAGTRTLGRRTFVGFLQASREKLSALPLVTFFQDLSLPELNVDRWLPVDASEIRNLADDQIRSLAAAALGRVQQLQGDVGRLQDRIEELEQRLSDVVNREEPKEEEVEPTMPLPN